MDNGSHQPVGLVPTAKLGDVIQRTAAVTFADLKLLLQNMKSWTQEIRTSKMRAYVALAKKRLCGLLALCKWLTDAEVRKHFQALHLLTTELANLENNLNEFQDGLYFAHRNLFAKRVRSMNVKMAREVLSTGKYDRLPVPIFSRGLMPKPESRSEIEVHRLKQNLSIFIKAKVALSAVGTDALPSGSFVATVNEGLLRVQKPNMFEILLTLQYADETAPWEIVGFRLLNSDSPRELSASLDIGYNIVAYGDAVLSMLRQATHKKSKVEDIFNLSARTIDTAEAIEAKPSAVIETVTEGVAVDVPLSLRKILSVCQYASESMAIRLLYAQSLRLKNHLFQGDLLEASYVEEPKTTSVNVKFWHSHILGVYRFGLNIKLTRYTESSIDPNASINMQIRINSLLKDNAKQDDSSSSFSDPTTMTIKDSLLKCHSALIANTTVDGISMRCLLQQVFSQISQLRLLLVAGRIISSNGYLHAANKGLELRLFANSLSFRLHTVKCDISVDIRTGRLCVEYLGVKSLAACSSRAIEAFEIELNNVVADRQLHEVMTSLVADSELGYLLVSSYEKKLLFTGESTADLMDSLSKSDRYHDRGPISIIQSLSTLELVLKNIYLAQVVDGLSMLVGVHAAPAALSTAMLVQSDSKATGRDEVNSGISAIFKIFARQPDRLPAYSTGNNSIRSSFSSSLQVCPIVGQDGPGKEFMRPLTVGSRGESSLLLGLFARNDNGFKLEARVYHCMVQGNRVPIFRAPHIKRSTDVPEHIVSDPRLLLQFARNWYDRGDDEVTMDVFLTTQLLQWPTPFVGVHFESFSLFTCIRFYMDISGNLKTSLGEKLIGKAVKFEADASVFNGLLPIFSVDLTIDECDYSSTVASFRMFQVECDSNGAILQSYDLFAQNLLVSQLTLKSGHRATLTNQLIAASNELAPLLSALYVCYWSECEARANSGRATDPSSKKRGREEPSDTKLHTKLSMRPLHINATSDSVKFVLLLLDANPDSENICGYFELSLVDKGGFGITPIRSKPDASLLMDPSTSFETLQFKGSAFHFKSIGIDLSWSESIENVTSATIANLLKRFKRKFELSSSIAT